MKKINGFTFNCHSELVSESQNHKMLKRVQHDRKGGFTLAEVLITLTIIGVIAALTIPNLLQKHQEQETVTRLKKAYSVFSNAYQQAIRENGPAEDWDIGPVNSAVGADKLYNYLKPYLKVQKYCKDKTGCFASSYKTMTGGEPWTAFDSHSNLVKAILEDGMSFYVWVASNGCTVTTSTGFNNKCGELSIDINGKKGPNKLGHDSFEFYILSDKIVPRTEKNSCVFKGTDSHNGIGCTTWVIYKGNMDYLHRDISSEYNFK